jgi:hypothetical protein
MATAPVISLLSGAAMTELRADVIIAGGGVGGCAAALAVARAGRSCVLIEPTDWIGGQLTSQAVPPDEHPWIEGFGCTRSYREFRNRVRGYYRRNYPLTAAARDNPRLNPGNGIVSNLCHEPRVALAVLEEMLAEHLSSGCVQLLLRHELLSADVAHDRVRAVAVRNTETGQTLVVHGAYFLDATELGDLLPLAQVEHVTGFESQADTGEPHAPPEAQPLNQQAFTCCFAVDYLDGEDHTINKPAEYDFWRSYVPKMSPAWPGRLFSWVHGHHITHEPVTHLLDPIREARGEVKGAWLYRRILDRGNFVPGAFAGDICLVNWALNDYIEGPLVGVDAASAAEHVRRAKSLSLSLLYWLQTESPRDDGGAGWRGLRLRPDIVGTSDGLAKRPYIRESRRIVPLFRVVQQHVSAVERARLGYAERFADSVGIGSYHIDLHPSSGGNHYIALQALPFQIPLGALVPVRMTNLLAAAKNIGTTHLTNGCYRLHPVEWNVGEAAGALAAHCLQTGRPPAGVWSNPAELARFQDRLVEQGFELHWPETARRGPLM